MGAGEYRRWQMYYMAEPWGAMRDNWHAGMIASAIYNARPGKKRRLAKVKDFLLRPKEEERAETTRSTLGWLMGLATKRRKRKKKHGE